MLVLYSSCLYIQVVINLRLKIRGHSLRSGSKLIVADLNNTCDWQQDVLLFSHRYPTTSGEWGGLSERKQNFPPHPLPHSHWCAQPTGTDLSANRLGLYAPTLLLTAIPWPSPLSGGRNLSPSLSRLSAEYAAINFYYKFYYSKYLYHNAFYWI